MGRKQCATKGCRKLAVGGEELCVKCKEALSEAEDPMSSALRLTEVELYKFNLYRMRVEHSLQSVRVLELEQDKAEREHVAAKHTRTQMINQSRKDVDTHSVAYRSFVASISEKYGILAKFLGIDDDTGVIHDMSPDT